jgi:LuxR family maltose regulon positive regulatory protein
MRASLVARLNQGLQKKLILVAAPAGYGKTTIIVDWLAQLPADCARTWLALDEGDNDPRRFLMYLAAALEQIQIGSGESIQAVLRSPQPQPDELILTMLMNQMTASPRSLVLVLDDYYFIHSLAIHKQLAFLLDHQPANMHLVLITRTDPLLPVARLRAQGQILEIHQDDLRFSSTEVGEFLQDLMELPLEPEDITTLERRTEGWIAGLSLVAISMQGRDDLKSFIQAFSGSSRFILDYLLEEVFEQQTPAMQDFLLKTSILGRLSGPLCAAVTRQENSPNLLEALEKANLFIISLDQSRIWYRYHHLFADLLLHRLRAAQPDRIQELHMRASRWFEAKGLPDEAIQHALAAHAWEEAARLVGQVTGELLNRGELVTLINWFQQLPEALLLTNPPLGLGYAWALLTSGRHKEAEPLLAHYETIGQSNPLLLGQVANAQAFAARDAGDTPRMVEKSELALALLPESEMPSRCLLSLNLGLVYWHDGRLREVGPVLDNAENLAARIGNDYARLTAQIFRARTLASQGSLRQAEAVFRSLVSNDSRVPIMALAHYDLACIYQEWAKDEQAWAHLNKGVEICTRGGNREFQNAGRLQKTLLWLAQGNLQAALAEIEEARTLAAEFNLVTQARVFAARALVALSQGDLTTARQWVEKMPADADPHSLYRFAGLTRARILLAEGKRQAAGEELAGLDQRAAASGWGYARVAILVLRALAAETPTAALAFLEEALRLGQPEGYLRTFTGAGPALVPLLKEAARRSPTPDYIGQILAAFSSNPPQPAGEPMVEPLSTRELEVLRLVTAGFSNREIAIQLIVSTNTVKTHIHNICGKLGARNRTEAAMLAKEGKLV